LHTLLCASGSRRNRDHRHMAVQLGNSAVRAEAKKALGNRFVIHAFHDEPLKDGALPISMLQAKMARWIDTTSR